MQELLVGKQFLTTPELDLNLKFIPINHLKEVLSTKPFSGTMPPPIVICDLDGVVFNSLKSYKNFSSLINFIRIAKKSSSMTVWSARFILPSVLDFFFRKLSSKQITPFPFMSQESIVKLKNLIARHAPDTDLTVKIGFNKLINGDLAALLKNKTSSQLPIVIIGSSYFDRSAANKLVKSRPDLFNRLWLFDTGKILI